MTKPELAMYLIQCLGHILHNFLRLNSIYACMFLVPMNIPHLQHANNYSTIFTCLIVFSRALSHHLYLLLTCHVLTHLDTYNKCLTVTKYPNTAYLTYICSIIMAPILMNSTLRGMHTVCLQPCSMYLTCPRFRP